MAFLLLLLTSCATSNELFYIASEKQDCVGVAKMQCLLVKTDKHQADWEYFYSNIKGFNFEEGFEYTLKVRVDEIKNPPADQANKEYTLIKIIEKKAVQ